MPRNMSFALTKQQVLNKTKTVTRRQGWDRLKIGDVLQPVEKGMGLKKGEKVKRLGGLIRVVDFRKEVIEEMSETDCALEGFPSWSAESFIEMYCDANRCDPCDTCNRIEFEYI